MNLNPMILHIHQKIMARVESRIVANWTNGNRNTTVFVERTDYRCQPNTIRRIVIRVGSNISPIPIPPMINDVATTIAVIPKC